MRLSTRSSAFDIESPWDWIEMAYERGWTDGLPVIPPTEERVGKALNYLRRDPHEVIGAIPPKQGIATVEKVVVNCVMAGCLPEHMPVVIASLEAMLEDPTSEGGTTGEQTGRRFNLNGVQATTSNCSPLTIVNGPAIRDIGFDCSHNALGSESRANASVGRAVRLVLWNIGGGIPGEIDMATLGHQGKYAYCIAENEASSPWEPLHVERGYSKEESAVTVIACDAHHEVDCTRARRDPLQILSLLSHVIAELGHLNIRRGGEMLLVFSPTSAQYLAQQGWMKNDIKKFMVEHARRPLRDLVRAIYSYGGDEHTNWPQWVRRTSDDDLIPAIQTTDDLVIVVTGPEGYWLNAVVPGWCDLGGYSVDRPVIFPGNT